MHNYRTKWVEIQGTKYKLGDCVLHSFEGEIPVFGQIMDIVLPDLNHPKFILNPLFTVAFSSHVHAYEVSYQHSISVIVCSQSDFVDHSVLSLYQSYASASTFYVPLRYHVLSDYD